MTLRNTPRPFRLLTVAAVAAVVALVAASCGDSSEVDEVPPATSAATAPETPPDPDPDPVMHPCDLDTADIVDGFCLADGRWWVDDGEGNWVESDGPPTTTTAADVEPPVTAPAEPEPTPTQPEPAPTTTVPAQPEPAPTTTVPAQPEPAPTTTVPAQPEPAPTTTTPPAPTTTTPPAPTTTTPPAPTTTLPPAPTTTTPPAPTTTLPPAPTTTTPPAPTTTLPPAPTTTTPPAPTTTLPPAPTTTTPPAPTTTLPPAPTTTTPPAPTTTLPEPEPEPEIARTADGWIIPVAGMVPEVHPDTPLAEWQRGPVNPYQIANDMPRQTLEVSEWVDWCTGVSHDCQWVQHHMHQALDYLGAYPRCVLDIYTKRINYYIRAGSGVNASDAAENFGWHLCATVIDPIIVDLPADRPATDVGYRLSDTAGITLAERCRIVLTGPYPDIQLETRSSGEPTRFGGDCDVWAAYIDGHKMSRRSPQCHASLALAEEWMEHVHDMHDLYFRPLC